MAVTRGKIHDYLGMTVDYSIPGKMKTIMKDYIGLRGNHTNAMLESFAIRSGVMCDFLPCG
jgi:hypothetical protein